MNEKKSLLARLGIAPSAQFAIADLLALVSHADGFKREEAVRRLGVRGDPAALPYLIERANDWVPQVREAAYDVLIQLLKAGNAAAFIASLPQLMHLQSCMRSDHRDLLASVEEFLLREENREALLGGMEHPEARVARLVIRLLASAKAATPQQIVARGLAHADPIVRSIAIDLLRDLAPAEFEAAMTQSLADRYMPVRREAFQQLLRRDHARGLKAARQFLFDASVSVREIAIHQLATMGESIEDLYSSALSADRVRVPDVKCVLWGWAAVNCRGRAQQVIGMLDSSHPGIRLAALQAITKLQGEDARPFLVAALSDESPAVCKEAARLICRNGVSLDADTLVGIASSSTHGHVAYACCRVARKGGKWVWLRFILSVYGSETSKVEQAVFTKEIDRWETLFNRTNRQPSQQEIGSIVHLLRASEAKLWPAQVRLLKFTLRSYGEF